MCAWLVFHSVFKTSFLFPSYGIFIIVHDMLGSIRARKPYKTEVEVVVKSQLNCSSWRVNKLSLDKELDISYSLPVYFYLTLCNITIKLKAFACGIVQWLRWTSNLILSWLASNQLSFHLLFKHDWELPVRVDDSLLDDRDVKYHAYPSLSSNQFGSFLCNAVVSFWRVQFK